MQTASTKLLPAVLTAALLLGSCGLVESENDKERGGIDSTYFCTEIKGGEVWRGESYASFSKQGRFYRWLTIFSDSINESNHRRYRISIYIPFNKRGNYSLEKKEYDINEGGVRTGGASFFESDWDVRVASYHATDDTSANQLTITSYDSTTGLMEGTFRTTVVVDSADRVDEPGEPPRRQPDTLRFTDGEFRVKVEDRR